MSHGSRLNRLTAGAAGWMRTRTASLWPSAFVLGGIGAFGLALGGSDTFGAIDPESRVVGVVVLLAGGMALIGAVCMTAPRLRTMWSRPLGLVAAAAGACLGILLTADGVGYPHPEHAVLWLVIAAASFVAGLPLIRMRPSQASAEKRPREQATVVGIVGATVPAAAFALSLLQFGYNTAYVPVNAGAALAITGNLSRSISASAAMDEYTIDLALKNTSSTKVQVVASLFSVSQSTVANIDVPNATDGTMFQHFSQGMLSGEQPLGKASRYTVEGDNEVVQLGRVVPDGWFFEPGEEYAAHLSVEAPKAPRSLLRLFVSMVVARGLRLNLADQPDYGPRLLSDGGYRYIVADWPIKRLSNVRALTAGDQAATVLYVLEGTTSAADLPFQLPEVFVCVDQASRVDDQLASHIDRVCPLNNAFQQRMRDYYGLVTTSTSFELPLTVQSDSSGARG